MNSENSTIVTTATKQPHQIFHVSVEYEEEDKPKIIKNDRKRRLVTQDEASPPQQQLLKQASPSVKSLPTIIIDEKSQDKIEESKSMLADIAKTKPLDKFEVFGMFVANEMRSLSNAALQKKLKRKILECILEINDDQECVEESTL